MPKTLFLAANPIGVMYAVHCAELSNVPIADRVLVVSSTGLAPVLATRLDRLPELQGAVEKFSQVLDWNQFVAPDHPGHWNAIRGSKHAADVRLLIESNVGEVSALVLMSLQASPAKALANVFSEVPITVYSDGLMAYGAVGKSLALHIGERVTKFVYLDLLDGVKPAAFRPYSATTYIPVKVGDYYDWVSTTFSLTVPEVAITEPTAVVVGQYLADLNLISGEADDELAARMVSVAKAVGCTRVIVREHPGSARASTATDSLGIGKLGLELWLNAVPKQQRHLVTVISVFSTALLTAKALGFNVISVGTEEVLQLLPATNSNRLPVAICDSSLPTATAAGSVEISQPRAGADNAEVREFSALLIDVFACIRQPGEYWRELTAVRHRIAQLSTCQQQLLRRYVTFRQLSNAGLVKIRPPQQSQIRKLWRKFVPKGFRIFCVRVLNL